VTNRSEAELGEAKSRLKAGTEDRSQKIDDRSQKAVSISPSLQEVQPVGGLDPEGV
jgi:hypothetical protein